MKVTYINVINMNDISNALKYKVINTEKCDGNYCTIITNMLNNKILYKCQNHYPTGASQKGSTRRKYLLGDEVLNAKS